MSTRDRDNNTQVTKMTAHAIDASVRTILKYRKEKFNRKLCMQVQGATIGAGVTGDVAGIFMKWTGRKLNI